MVYFFFSVVPKYSANIASDIADDSRWQLHGGIGSAHAIGVRTRL